MIGKMLSGKHILIAEDNLTNQIVVTKMIEHLGATFDLAENGQEAIDLFEINNYDLALLDIEMPKKSGLEVIRYIRASQKRSPSFPIVALTAYVLTEHRTKILDAGATSIIAKPILGIEKFGETLLFVLEMSNPKAKSLEFVVDEEPLKQLAVILGPEATIELVGNLQSDLTKISKDLSDSQLNLDANKIGASTHSLLSLAGITGADSLKEVTQNLNEYYLDLSADELVLGVGDVIKGIDMLKAYLDEKFGKIA